MQNASGSWTRTPAAKDQDPLKFACPVSLAPFALRSPFEFTIVNESIGVDLLYKVLAEADEKRMISEQ